MQDHIGTRIVVGPAGASFSGLKKCSSPWSCPLCATSIARTRVEELAAAVEGWQAAGNSAAMVTLTMRHTARDALLDLFEAKSKALTAVRESAAVRRHQGASGYVARAVKTEVTWGLNGWHVHLHMVLFFNGDDARSGQRWADVAFPVWRRKLGRMGLEPDQRHGVDVKPIRAGSAAHDVAAYVAKDGGPTEALAAALEVAGGSTGKIASAGNVSTWEILGRAVTGDEHAARLWSEWEVASKGRQALVWSRGARTLLGLGEEVTDEQAGEDQGWPDPVVAIHPDSWKLIRRQRRVNHLLDVAEVAYDVDRVSGGDGRTMAQLAVMGVLHEWGIPPSHVVPLADVRRPEPPSFAPAAPQQLGMHLQGALTGV